MTKFSERPDDLVLPPGWAEVRLGSVATTRLGKMLDKARGAGVPLRYLRNINVRWTTIDLTNLFEMPFGDGEIERFSIRDGDVLVCEGGEPGRAAVWRGGVTNLKYQKALHRVRLSKGVSPQWLVYNLYHDSTRGALAKYFTGTTIAHFTGEAINEYIIRIAPMGEQARVLDAIESYFSRLDDAATTLERVERNLKRYRASVLKSAVEGRLVPTEAALAKQEGRTYEPASVLLERILSERRRRWSESGKKGKYQEPTPPDTTDLPKLPEGWCWTSIDSLVWDADYGTSQKCDYDAKGPPVLRIPNVQDQAVRLSDLKFATDPDGLNADGAVKVGDLVFIRTNGSKNLIGRGAVVLEELPVPHHFASYLIRLRVLPIEGLPRWAGFAWHTPTLREQILADAASSAGQYNVSMKAALRFAVPLAPAAEQLRILEEVERIDSLAETTLKAASVANGRSARLRQAILKWAFEGKLADQDPTDEPASVLLERIKAERTAAKPAKPATPQRKAAKTKKARA